jgi:hypothetical protein
MTEAQWLASNDPAALLRFATDGWVASPGGWGVPVAPPSERRLRLFAVACCRLVEGGVPCGACEGRGRRRRHAHDHPGDPCDLCRGTGRVGGLTDPRSRRAVEVAERYADGGHAEEGLALARLGAVEAFHESGDFDRELVTRLFGPVTQLTCNAGLPRWFSVSTKLAPSQAALLRCVFGNPWRPMVGCRCDPDVGACPCEWCDLTRGTPYQLARAIHDERRPADLPVLWDALSEAGCQDEAIHAHCLEPLHARGCWVIDLILGKD